MAGTDPDKHVNQGEHRTMAGDIAHDSELVYELAGKIQTAFQEMNDLKRLEALEGAQTATSASFQRKRAQFEEISEYNRQALVMKLGGLSKALRTSGKGFDALDEACRQALFDLEKQAYEISQNPPAIPDSGSATPSPSPSAPRSAGPTGAQAQ